jgi:uncharacterized nucleotidyltransferase DUF6036
MMKIQTRGDADTYLEALGQQLGTLDAQIELVVIGGSALLALGLVDRATRDVDVVAVLEGGAFKPVDPLPEALRTARDRVARDFRLPGDWLNAEPASLLDLGLPAGFLQRAVRVAYGPALTVWYASRIDQIHFKLYAVVDQGPGKHESDLRALGPTSAELMEAARWSRTHDPSEGYEAVLGQVLEALGAADAPIDS